MGWRPSISCLRCILEDRVVLTPQLEGDQLGAPEQEPLALVRCRVNWFFALRFLLVLLVRCWPQTSHEAHHASIPQGPCTKICLICLLLCNRRSCTESRLVAQSTLEMPAPE